MSSIGYQPRSSRSLLVLVLVAMVALLAARGSAPADATAVTHVTIAPSGALIQEVDFGMIPNGASSPTQLVILTNSTNGVLYGFSWLVGGTHCGTFDVVPPQCLQEAASFPATGNCPQDLYPDDSCTLSIAFQPVTTGALLAVVNLRSNGRPDTTATFLAGAGTPLTALTAGTVLVVEYYAPALDHYFYTVTPEEMTALDTGVIPGWARTGFFFWAYPSDGSAPAETQAVCRFYGLPEARINSHFYSVSVDECRAVAQNWPLSWILESPDYFHVYQPQSFGACPADVSGQFVYRLYNNRADANHRFTTSQMIQDFMVYHRDWIPEGYGLYSVAMCTPY
jgi:hypothetical protein